MAEGGIAVLGAGPGGLAVAAQAARSGHMVSLYSRSDHRLRPIVDGGGIRIEEDDELVPIGTITTDVVEAVRDSTLVLVSVPAFAQEPLVSAAAAALRTDAVLVLMPGSCGSLAVLPILRNAGHDLDSGLLLGETVTLPYSARMTGPGQIRIRLPSQLRAAALPATRTAEFVERTKGVLDLKATRHVFDPGLNNPNFLIHPAPMLLNFAEVERRKGVLSIMNEGMTDAVLRCMDVMDEEKMAICRVLGLEAVTIDDIYRGAGSGPEVYRVAGEPFNLTDRVWDRYVTEDVPYGSVLIASLAAQLGVAAPVSESVSNLFEVIMEQPYWEKGRTVERLGLSGFDAAQIVEFAETGKVASQ